jgi:hypothetical protein
VAEEAVLLVFELLAERPQLVGRDDLVQRGKQDGVLPAAWGRYMRTN